MMNARLNKALVALLAVSVAGACDDAPVDVAVNDADRLVTNPSFVVIEAGESRLVQAYLANALGNPVAGDVDFEACNAAISVEADPNQSDLEPGTNFVITGNTLGESCVNVSGAGEEETIIVRVVPAELELTLADTLLSGSAATAGVLFLNAGGTAATGFDLDEVSFSSLDDDIASVDPVTGEVTAKAPGTVGIVVTLDEGLGAPRADTFNVVIVPGDFAGTVTPNTGVAGTIITANFAASDPRWDASSTATITAGFTTYDVTDGVYILDGTDSVEVITAIPIGAAAGTATLVLSGLGPDEVALAQTFTVTSTETDDPYGDTDVFLGEDPHVVPAPFDLVGSIDGTNGELNDTYEFTATVSGAHPVYLNWVEGSHDLDILVYDLTADGFHACTGSVATGAHPEQGNCTLVAGQTYWFIINDYEESGLTTPYRLRVRNP